MFGSALSGLGGPTPSPQYATSLRRISAVTTPARPVVHAAAPPRYRAVPFRQGNEQKTLFIPVARVKRQVAQIYRVMNGVAAPAGVVRILRTSRGVGYGPYLGGTGGVVGGPTGGSFGGPTSVPIGGPGGKPVFPLLPPPPPRKLNDLYLSLQLLNTQATTNDFTVDLSGEFSPNAQGGTPFGAFPVTFPSYYDNHMAEFILSDYTINSLFYHLHRKQFLSFRIGPETPKIGELLKTTCSEEEEDELEPTQVELDEESRRRRALKSLKKTLRRTKRQAHTTQAVVRRGKQGRGKRQDDAAGLADLGICFGDILPAVREKYPNQKIAIQIRTVRAPSLIFSAARGDAQSFDALTLGMVTLDLLADADIYIDGTNNRVGTITIATTVAIVAQLRGNRLTGSAEITNLKLTDRTGSLGLPQDALDNLGNLGKELIQKLANDALQKGITINIPLSGLGGLPINIINPEVRIIEHGLYIATDLTISPSIFGVSGSQC
ncbi:LBP / BPI / CETP family protein [Oesophagostomum dentatum]|uniref:LBP / BPI / CETP family protein n=1 Tax=Oesophagostomum dentatum TaxID=61180 RepID=A0A0B1THD3_OESDE|nr:LBP / BPI / CETP family protein [Oesophagostomum dentatum]